MSVSSLAVGLRTVSAPRAAEFHLTIAPDVTLSPHLQAGALYHNLRQLLEDSRAHILSERIFATQAAMAETLSERRIILGRLDDGVGPTRIIIPTGMSGEIAGIQVHAVAAGAGHAPAPVALSAGSHPQGRKLEIDGQSWLMLSEVCSPDAVNLPVADQAAAMFEAAGQMLKQNGADMRSVARTWLWLDDICAWYGDFNAARTTFFKRHGLIRPDGSRPRLPASTGIGVGNAAGRACVLDVLALPGGESRIRFLEAAGHQNSAYAYGSAFSRAAIVPMPAGDMLFVSGTAAIDAQGRTEHVGDIRLQIEATIHHIRALMAQAGCADENVLSALVYCKTPLVQQAFHVHCRDLVWPSISMVAEVCRSDLLFEIELIAGPVSNGQAAEVSP